MAPNIELERLHEIFTPAVEPNSKFAPQQLQQPHKQQQQQQQQQQQHQHQHQHQHQQHTETLKTLPKRATYRKLNRSADLLKALFCVGLFVFSTTYAYEALHNEKTAGFRFFKDNEWMNFFVGAKFQLYASFAYVMTTMVGCRVMQREGQRSFYKEVKTYFQPIYNVTQIVLCFYMAVGLFPFLDFKNGNPFGINIQRNATIEWFLFIHYISKYLDWFDTAFMVLKKNFDQISFLHVFHHATINLVWGFTLAEGFGAGVAFYGGFINSVTHVIMYTHYLWTSFGFVNPFKKQITNFQLAQFMSCVLHAFLAYGFDKNMPRELCLMQICYHINMLFLFSTQLSWVPSWINGVYEEKKKEI